DHIIELSFIKLSPNGERITKTQRVNPGVPIPSESTQFHGITNEDVKDAPTFKQIAKELVNFLEGCDLSGFAVIKFDVPMLVEEFLRVDVEFEIKNRKIIDSQKIFHLMEKRNLSSAYRFYCGKELEDAHSAEADTIASLEVLESQVERYAGQDVVDLKDKKLGVVENDMAVLHDLTNSNLVDLEIEDYYEGFSNETLWPNFHYFNQYCVYNDQFWDAYKKVNEKFAKEIVAVVGKYKELKEEIDLL
ncbi:Bifunctional trehalose-6-phosphate synthase/phosphatase [Includes: Alpha, partial [Durusdinium trenchii]